MSTDALAAAFARALDAHLGGAVIGAWWCGSIALGAWDARRSDVDFVVAIDGEPDARAIAAVHRALRGVPLADRMEGVYAPARALREGWYVQRGRLRGRGRISAVARAELHTGGVRVIGADVREVVPAPSPDELRAEMRWNLDVYWRGRARRPWLFLSRAMADFAAQTLPRIAHTLATGRLIAKPTPALCAGGRFARAREALRLIEATRRAAAAPAR